MTREERELKIADLKKRQDFFYDKDIALLIQLLKQEPCEEAISRQAVLDILDYWYDSDSSEYVQAERSICDLPSVNPQKPKTDVLDKIRAELLLMECMEDAVEVVDKYRQEG